MKHDDFLVYLYTFSQLSDTTQRIYKDAVTRCCQHYHRPHCLDLSVEDLDLYRVYLLTERYYSPSSDTIVYNAFRQTYVVLLPQVDAEAAAQYVSLYDRPPRQLYRLPEYVSQHDMARFLHALPKTVSGHIIRQIYATSQSFEAFAPHWKANKAYVRQVCAKTARLVGIQHGFGLTGVRAASILHRIQNRANDTELDAIRQDSGLSLSQFARYLHVAGVTRS